MFEANALLIYVMASVKIHRTENIHNVLVPKPWLCGFEPGVIYETKACQSTTSHGFWPIASRNGGWMCGGSAMIRNNKRIKGGLVWEEARRVDMGTYGVEEFRRILSFQLNRHWRSFVFKLCCR